MFSSYCKAILFFAGQLIREKGIYTLLEAFFLFIKANPHVAIELWFAGDGPEALSLAERSKIRGLNNFVRFLGLRNNVPKLMSNSVCNIVPSEWPEAFGFVAAEAMASGVPLIVSNAGSLPEVVSDCALIFEKGDPSLLAELLSKVFHHRMQFREMAGRAQLRVQEKFSLTRMVSDYTNLFQEVCEIHQKNH